MSKSRYAPSVPVSRFMKHVSFTTACDEKALEIFAKIYEYALAGDKNELLKLAKTYSSFNIHQGLFTPIALLAMQGEDAAVKLLIQLGVNHDDAAFGYAVAGNLDKVAELLPDCLNKESALMGFILGKHNRAADLLIKNNQMQKEAYFAGCATYNDEYISRFRFYRFPRHIHIKAAAISGDLSPLAAAEKTPENVMAAIEGSIMGSHLKNAEDIAEMYCTTIENNHEYFEAYAKSGNTGNIERFFDSTVAVDTIAGSYARAGNHKLVEEIYKPERPGNIIMITEGYIKGGYFDSKEKATRLLALIENVELRSAIALTIDKYHTPLSVQVEFTVSSLLEKAAKLHDDLFQAEISPGKEILFFQQVSNQTMVSGANKPKGITPQVPRSRL